MLFISYTMSHFIWFLQGSAAFLSGAQLPGQGQMAGNVRRRSSSGSGEFYITFMQGITFCL